MGRELLPRNYMQDNLERCFEVRESKEGYRVLL